MSRTDTLESVITTLEELLITLLVRMGCEHGSVSVSRCEIEHAISEWEVVADNNDPKAETFCFELRRK